jgi:hypothetical protein
MNYYYELNPGVQKAFGEQWPWWCLANCSIADGGLMPHLIHDEFVANSHRVWLENANGVYLVKPDWYGQRHRVDIREFTLIKLRARMIAYEQA